MSRLKIVHAAKFYPPMRGGMETVIGDLCDGTSAEWDVSVVAAHDQQHTLEERCGRVDVIRAATFGSINSVPICPSFALYLWRQQADCVVLHEPNPIAGTSLFLHKPAKHLIIWHHSDLLRPWWAPYTYGLIQRALYRRAECVIVSSPNLAAHSRLLKHARRVEVIPFGIPLDRFSHLDDRRRAIADRLNVGRPGPHVLFVGRFVYYKGVDVLIDAMARVNATLFLVGEGPLEVDLRLQVRDKGMQDRVIFIGRVAEEDLPAYYHAADVFVLPSVAITEAFGVVQIEAMAAGVPVVSTNLPTGVPWVNQHGVSGLVVAPGDAGALAEALNQLLGDGELRTRLGRGASARAAALFSRERMIDSFKEVVERAVREPVAVEAKAARTRIS